MIRTLAYLLLILIGLCISPWLVEHTGYVYLSLGDYELETSVAFALVALIVFYSLLQLVEWVLISLLNMLVKFNLLPSRWRKSNARKHTLSGALALAEEDWASAESEMLKGADSGELPTVNWLAAARAAQHQGRAGERDSYLANAANYPNTKQAVSITKTRYLMQQGELAAARSELDLLHPEKTNKSSLIKIALDLYQLQQDWSAVKLLLPKVQKTKLLAHDELAELTQKTNQEIIREASAHGAAELDKAWHWLSRSERKQSSNLAQYILGLCRCDKKEQALKLLIKGVKDADPSPIFVVIPAIVNAEDKKVRELLLSIEKKHEQSAVFNQCMAELYVQTRQLDDAVIYWQKVNEISANKNSWHALAKVYEQLGQAPEALHCYREMIQIEG
ncbi:MAG: heme biosynthesis HemY N-terminal domain-containing protein [Parashewanella sp.]